MRPEIWKKKKDFLFLHEKRLLSDLPHLNQFEKIWKLF